MKNVLRTLIFDNQVSLTLIDGTEMVNKAIALHHLSPNSAKILGRALCAMSFASAALKMESQTERVKLVKISQTDHIDGMAAIIDAMIGRQKYWAEDGQRLQNMR